MKEHKKAFFKSVPGIIMAVVGGIILAALFAFIFGFVVMYLWNNVLVQVTGVKPITFMQAFGIIILCKILVAPTNWKNKQSKGCRTKHEEEFFNEECGSGWGKWKHYDEYWKNEGKKAYEEYLARKTIKDETEK